MRRSDIDARLDELYAQVPQPNCKGLCADSCGPIDMHPRERQRIRARGVTIPHHDDALDQLDRDGDYACPALKDDRCTTYADRPMICFLPDAWVYTDEGPKQIKDIYAGDRVYGMDGKLHRVVATASRYYEGPVINVRHTGTHVPCWSTADHQWFAARHKDRRKAPAPEWRPAEELIAKRQHQAGDYLCFPRVFEDVPPLQSLDVTDFVQGKLVGDHLEPFTSGAAVRGIMQQIPARIPVDEDFLFMLGIYLAEGNASIQSATFTMHLDELPILECIGKYLETLGITSQFIRTRGKTSALTVSSALFGRLMKALGGVGAMEKRIRPSLFARLSHAQLWAIYEAWDLGDGRKCLREKDMSTTTNSEQLAVQMGFVALANGFFPRMYVAHKSDRNGTTYDVHLFPSNWRGSKPGHGTKNMYDDAFVYTPATGASGEEQYRSPEVRRDYQGPVFDLQVEDAESFVTSSGIAHNCRLWGAVDAMACEHGCRPEGGLLSDQEGALLLQESLTIGMPDAEVIDQQRRKLARRFADPAFRQAYKDFIRHHQPGRKQ
ncbi:YkgJ family cysteine cluster protein [Nonomuraea maritima]|uniref:YkgJ family cysteine cluster protein n=1 Tax=Nonomuraea maritima TaxID=683260 RepID=UPI00372367FC